MLGIKLIAEGIETKEQMQLLIEAAANYGQGDYFAYPFDASYLEEYMHERKTYL